MIIIEGPDGAGKSTLGKMLVEHKLVQQCLLSPKRAYPNDPLYESTRAYMNRWIYENRVAVDRFILSEIVYGPILRGKCEFSQLQTAELLADIFESGSIIIFCLPDVSSLIFKKDESEETIGKIFDLHKEYGRWSIACRMLSRKPANIIRYMWNQPQAWEVLYAYLRRLNGERKRL